MFSVDGLTHSMGFSDFAAELSAPADRFRCKVRWVSCYGSAREALPCTERRDAKQPGHLAVRAVCLAERTYSRQESIEVRPLFQRDLFVSESYAIVLQRKVTICALVQSASGLNVAAPVPLVMSFLTAHNTAPA